MSAQRFEITDVNPNDAVGGGGCVCSPEKVTDCKGPFAVFYATEMGDTPYSPHVVIGCACAKAVAAAMDGEVASVSQGEEANVVTPSTPETYAGDPYAIIPPVTPEEDEAFAETPDFDEAAQDDEAPII